MVLRAYSAVGGERARITNDYNIMCGDNHSLWDIIARWPMLRGRACMAAERQIAAAAAAAAAATAADFCALKEKARKHGARESWPLLIPALKYTAEQTGPWMLLNNIHTHFQKNNILERRLCFFVKIWAHVYLGTTLHLFFILLWWIKLEKKILFFLKATIWSDFITFYCFLKRFWNTKEALRKSMLKSYLNPDENGLKGL